MMLGAGQRAVARFLDGRRGGLTEEERVGHGLRAGARHYRAFVGPTGKFDLVSAMQFNLLTSLGLREHHCLLDIGCGSLRAARLFIPYLLPGRYFGVEPERWLVEEGIRHELGRDLFRIKRPSFLYDESFRFGAFGRTFDFLLAQSVFSHAATAQIAACLREARRVMQPSSIFAATFVSGDCDYAGDEWVYPGVVTYRLDRIVELAADAGLACERLEWSHPNGQTWVRLTPSRDEANEA